LPPAQTVQIPIQAGADDAEESASGTINLSSTDLELVQETTTQRVGLRFAGVGIPRGATIDLAYVQFQVDEVGSTTTNLTITGQDVGNAPAFGTSVRNISSRARTPGVSWPNVSPWPTLGARGGAQQTPDLKTILQRIVTRGDWNAGQAIALVIEGTGKRVASSFEIGLSARPVLVVQFRAAAGSTTTSSTTTTTTTQPPTTTRPATTSTTTTSTTTTTRVTTSTAPTSTSSSTTTVTNTTTSATVTTTLPPGGVRTYQAGVSGPVGSADVDANVRLSAPTTNYGTDANLYVGVTNGADKVYRSMVAFRLADVPAGAIVTDCRLTVNVTQRTNPTPGHVRRLCGEHWLDGNGQGEAQVTWNGWKTGSPWGGAGASSTASCATGGDYTTVGEVPYTPPAGTGTFTFPSLTALCQDALVQRAGWLRLRISQASEATQSNLIKFDSSDATTATNRPKLVVTWSGQP
jgi:hypothetical protein